MSCSNRYKRKGVTNICCILVLTAFNNICSTAKKNAFYRLRRGEVCDSANALKPHTACRFLFVMKYFL